MVLQLCRTISCLKGGLLCFRELFEARFLPAVIKELPKNLDKEIPEGIVSHTDEASSRALKGVWERELFTTSTLDREILEGKTVSRGNEILPVVPLKMKAVIYDWQRGEPCR